MPGRLDIFTPRSLGLAAAALLGAFPVCALGFVAGGYFPGSAEVVAVVFAAGLAAWLFATPAPAGNLSVLAAVAVGALALYCAWTLASMLWSDSPFRAARDFDRALLYLLALAAGVALGSDRERLRWLVRGVAFGGFVVCVAALASRTHPDVFTTTPQVNDSRLSFPITYWNGLGTLAAITLILSVSIAANLRAALPVRVCAAAATPVLAATLILTLSRGSIGVAIGGLVVFAVLGFGRGLVTAALAIAPACAVAVVAALRADLLVSHDPRTAAAVTEGHDLALVVALAVAGAGVLILVVHPLERRLPRQVSRPFAWGAAVTAIVVVAGVALAAGLPGVVDRALDEFASDPGAGSDKLEQPSDRLTNFSNNGRVDGWRIALDEFERRPLNGSGAGTYEETWQRHRPFETDVRDAHSLYLENLSELGVVGLGLLATLLAAVALGLLRRLPGPDRVLYAGIAAAAVAWAVESGFDWIWELPAVSVWFFVTAGAVLAARPRPWSRPWRLPAKLAAAAGLLVLCVLPVRVAVSQLELERGLDAIAAGDCGATIEHSLASASAFDSRGEPYALMGYCDARLGRPRLGVTMFERARARDPGYWMYEYGYALLRAAAGLDPRPAARRALELNPRERMTIFAAEAFAGDDPDRWRRRAPLMPLPGIWGQPLG